MSKNYFHAIATLIGTIVGVGMFAVPFVVSRSSIILLFIYLPILGIAQYFLHKFYAEIILSTKGKHRLPGYAEKYFGKGGKTLTLIIVMLGNYGALLAYIIIGGIFAHELLSPMLGGSAFIYSVGLFIIEALIVLFGLRLIASVELVMAGLLVMLLGLIAWRGWGNVNIDNYAIVNWSNLFLPYGPIFFAVGGGAAIPSVCKLLAQKKENIKSAIAWGTFIPVIITAIFTVVVVGVTGINTSPDTLVGLHSVFTNGVITVALIFGLLSVFTSFLIIAQAIRETYWWDFGMNKNIAWFLACFIPFILYVAGLQNLIKVISLTGAVIGGLAGIIIIQMALRVKKKKEQKSVITNGLNSPVAYILSLLFILGLIYEIWTVMR